MQRERFETRPRVSGTAGIVLGLLLSVACATSDRNEAEDIAYPNPSLPEWVAAPYVEGGLVQTECVVADAPMSILRGRAVTLARSSLSSELQTALQDLKVNYQKLATTNEGTSFDEQYDRVTKEILDQTLTGSRPARVDYVSIEGQRQLCAMVIIDEKNTARLREEVVARTGMNLSADQEAQLWQQFVLTKAEESLSKERAR